MGNKDTALQKLKQLKTETLCTQVSEIISLVEVLQESSAYAHSCPKTYIVNGNRDEEPVKYVVVAQDERIAERLTAGLGVKVVSIASVDGPTPI